MAEICDNTCPYPQDLTQVKLVKIVCSDDFAALINGGGGGGSGGTELIEKCLCMVDDTASDGSNLVTFTRVITLNVTTGALVASYDYTEDLSATYTVLGTVSLCTSTGTAAVLVPHRQHLSGATTFNLPALTQSITFKIRTVGDALNPPTITDNDGTTPFYDGIESWSAQDGNFAFLTGTLDLELFAGDEVTVIWTQLE